MSPKLPMLPISYGENSYWLKFSKYEIFKNEKGLYIIPAQKSEKIIYNPYDVEDRLVTDYLNFGKAVFEGLENTPKINRALSLVKKYGLLGILTSSRYFTYTSTSKYSNKVFSDDYELIGEQTLQEYIQDFFPDPSRQPPLGHNNEDYTLQFYKNYSENINWITQKACNLYEHYKNIEEFKNIKEVENLELIEYIHKVFDSRFKIKSVDLWIYYDEVKKAYLCWEAHNLFKMIDIMYALKLIDTKNGLATCQYCGTIYQKTRKDKKYCSDECGNSFRVRKHHKKNGLEG